MANMIKSIRSTLNFLLAILELFISTLLAIRVFSSDVGSENGLVGYISDFFGMMRGGTIWLVGSNEVTGSASFLVVILIFMVFGQALFFAIPGIIERGQKNSVRTNRHQVFIYKKRRFIKSRFF